MDIPADNVVSAEQRTWALAAHLSSLLGHLIPFGNIIAPLIVWVIKKDQMPFVDDQGKEAINFNITCTIAFVVAAVLCLVFIGILLLPAIWLAWVILTIIAAVNANNGVAYRYPTTLRLVK